MIGRQSLDKIRGKSMEKIAILRANSSQSERVLPRGIGMSKGVKNKAIYRAKSRKPNCRLDYREQ